MAATDGPLQVALMLSATFASLVALKNGYTSAALADAAVGGVTTAVAAIFVLLAVGALIGTWNIAGTIPTVVDYGVKLLNPSVFFFATAAICAIVGIVTGSSWTTADTLGVAFVGMASVMGVSEATAAVNSSAIGLNVTAGDQYVADVLPARMFREEFRRRELAPQVLSRAVENSGTVTSPLVPWNTCGAYMSGVLGVSTAAYLPYCFFNLLSPVLERVVRLPRGQGPDDRPGGHGGRTCRRDLHTSASRPEMRTHGHRR